MSKEPSFFHEAIAQIVAMHEKKAHDYTSGGEFGNFIEAAMSADIEVHQAIEALIATKEARIRTIHRNNKNGEKVRSEPLLDSYLDRAVYAIISYAYVLSQKVDVQERYKEQYETMLKSQENITPGAYLGGKR